MKRPSIRQKRAIKLALENGGNISKAMRDAGYSPATAKNPDKLTETRAWQDMIEEYLPDEDLLRVNKEGLEATRVISAIANGKQASGATTDFIEVPDHATRHKYLETAYKVKGRLAPDPLQNDTPPLIVFNILNVSATDQSHGLNQSATKTINSTSETI